MAFDMHPHGNALLKPKTAKWRMMLALTLLAVWGPVVSMLAAPVAYAQAVCPSANTRYGAETDPGMCKLDQSQSTPILVSARSPEDIIEGMISVLFDSLANPDPKHDTFRDIGPKVRILSVSGDNTDGAQSTVVEGKVARDWLTQNFGPDAGVRLSLGTPKFALYGPYARLTLNAQELKGGKPGACHLIDVSASIANHNWTLSEIVIAPNWGEASC